MRERAQFGPSGNSRSFAEAGFKHTKQAPAWLEAMGLDAYEYSAGNGITGSDETFRIIGEQARLHHIALSLHAPYFISLSGIDPEKRLGSLKYIRRSIEAAETMGADTIVIHTGSASKISREEAVDLAKDTIYKALEDNPDSKIKLGLETMGKLNQLGTLEEVLDICKLDRRLVPVVDFGHMNARHLGGLFVTADDYKRVFDRIACELDDATARFLHCHFSKIEYTKAGEKKHLTFEDHLYGPEFEPLIEAITAERLCPRLICESDGTMAEDALAMKTYYDALNQ